MEKAASRTAGALRFYAVSLFFGVSLDWGVRIRPWSPLQRLISTVFTPEKAASRLLRQSKAFSVDSSRGTSPPRRRRNVGYLLTRVTPNFVAFSPFAHHFGSPRMRNQSVQSNASCRGLPRRLRWEPGIHRRVFEERALLRLWYRGAAASSRKVDALALCYRLADEFRSPQAALPGGWCHHFGRYGSGEQVVLPSRFRPAEP